MALITRDSFTCRELAVIEHCFNISQELRKRLPHFYLKVWGKTYTLERIFNNGEANNKTTLYDGDFLYKIKSPYSKYDLIRSSANQFGLSFRAIDIHCAYVIIKPWYESHKIKE